MELLRNLQPSTIRMKKSRFAHCLMLLVFGFGFLSSISFSQDGTAPEKNIRNWTNTQGKAIQGTLLGVEGDKVRLLVNGKEFLIPLSGLSAADNTYVQEWKAQVSVARTQQMRVLRSQGAFEIFGKNGKLIASVSSSNAEGGSAPDAPKTGDDPATAKNLATQSKQLLAGQTMRTKTGASVDLYSTTGAIVRVQGETELRIPDEKDVPATSSLHLLKGSLFLNIDAKRLQTDRKEFRLKTPTALLAVKGTQFFVEVKPDETISGVYEGEVGGSNTGGKGEDISPGFVAQFYEDRVETRKMSEKEIGDRTIFDALSVTKSSLAERKWGWNAFDWEVHSLLRKDGPTGKKEISNINIKRGKNTAGNLATQFRPIDEAFQYGEFRLDSVVRELGDNFLGAEFRIRANKDVKLIITTIGADQKELAKKKGGLLDQKGYEYLVQFHNLATIREHKNLYWENFQLEDEKVKLKKDQWTTHFVPFSRNDYPKSYDVKSWFIFLCLGPEVVAEREIIELEVAPPVLVFKKETEE